MTLMLFCMKLIVYAEDNKGDDDTYGDNNGNDNVAPCCLCCYVTFETSPIHKHSCFLAKTSLLSPISKVFARLSQKPHQQT